MRTARTNRGSALPETAIVLTASLAMVFGIIQIGVIGYLQLTVDGAAFVAAHEYSLLNTSTYIATTEVPFPLNGATPIAIATNPPDNTSVPVNYNTSNTTDRQGGVSLVRRDHLQATVTQQAPAGLLGVGIPGLSGVGVHGAAIEPNSEVGNDVYDVNASGYSGSGGKGVPFFNDVQNGPANYIGMETMSYCNEQHYAAACPTNYQNLNTLGNGEFLDHDNWNRSNLGVGDYLSGYTFGEMLCHQQVYALAAATQFQPALTLLAIPKINIASPTGAFATIMSWDYTVSSGGGYPPSESTFDLYPLHPGKGCA